MDDILLAKARCVPAFRQALSDSGSSTIVEATNNIFWGSGLNDYLTKTTKPTFYRGENALGYVLQHVRSMLPNMSSPTPRDRSDATESRDSSPSPMTTTPRDSPDVTTTRDVAPNLSVESSNDTPQPTTMNNDATISKNIDDPISTPNVRNNDGEQSVSSPPQPAAAKPQPDLQLVDLLTGAGSTPLLSPAGSTCDLTTLDGTHDVLPKQLFTALSTSSPLKKTRRPVKKITDSRPKSSDTKDIATYFDGPSKRKASSELPSPPAAQRSNIAASPAGTTS